MSKKSTTNPLLEVDYKIIKDIMNTKPMTAEIKRSSRVSPTDAIIKDYAEILVNEMLSGSEQTAVMAARTKLKFYDDKLRQQGLRATVKIGIEKI